MQNYITMAYILLSKRLSELNLEIILWALVAIFVLSFAMAIIADKCIYRNKYRYRKARRFLIKRQFITDANEKAFCRNCLFGVSKEFKKEWTHARKNKSGFNTLLDRIPSEIKQVGRPQIIYNVLFALSSVLAFFVIGIAFDFQIALFTVGIYVAIWAIGMVILCVYEKILFWENSKFADKFIQLIDGRILLEDTAIKQVKLSENNEIRKIQTKNIFTMRQDIRNKEIGKEVDNAIQRMKNDEESKDKLIDVLLEKPIINEKVCENVELTSNVMGFESIDELIDSVNIFIRDKGDKGLAKMMLDAIEQVAKTNYSNAAARLKLQLSAQSLKKYVS